MRLDPANFPRFSEAGLRNRFHPPVSSDFPQISASEPGFRTRLSFSKAVPVFSDDDRILPQFLSDPAWILKPGSDRFLAVSGVANDQRILDNLALLVHYRKLVPHLNTLLLADNKSSDSRLPLTSLRRY